MIDKSTDQIRYNIQSSPVLLQIIIKHYAPPVQYTCFKPHRSHLNSVISITCQTRKNHTSLDMLTKPARPSEVRGTGLILCIQEKKSSVSAPAWIFSSVCVYVEGWKEHNEDKTRHNGVVGTHNVDMNGLYFDLLLGSRGRGRERN